MFLISAILPLVLLLQAPAKPPADKVLATVNGAPIRAADVEGYLWDWRAYEVTQELILADLVRQEAERLKLSATDPEIAKAVDDQIAQLRKGLQPNQDLSAALRAQGYTRSRLALRARTQILLDKIGEATFRPADFVKVSTILFKPKSELAAELDAAKKQADAAYGRLRAGDRWLLVLQSATDDKTMQNNEGLVGWLPFEAFPSEAATEIRGLPAGGFTKPVRTQYGYQIFRVEKQGKDAAGADLQELKSGYSAGARSSVLRRLWTNAKIERFFSDDLPKSGG